MAKKRSGGISTSELFQDAEFRRRNDESLEKLRQAKLESDRVYAPLLHKLGEAGFVAASFEEFGDRYAPLPRMAVEILISSIPTFGDDDRAKEMVVRQLAAAAEPFDGTPLVELFEATTGWYFLRWAILNTIACAMPHSISAWLHTARRDAWIEKTLQEIGKEVHGADFEKYLTFGTGTTAPETQAPAEVGHEFSGRYHEVYGPVLLELRQAGFHAHSIEELRERFSPLTPAVVHILLAALPRLDGRDKLLVLHALETAAEPFDGTELAASYDTTTDELLKRNILRTMAVTKPHSVDKWINSLAPETKRLLGALGF